MLDGTSGMYRILCPKSLKQAKKPPSGPLFPPNLAQRLRESRQGHLTSFPVSLSAQLMVREGGQSWHQGEILGNTFPPIEFLCFILLFFLMVHTLPFTERKTRLQPLLVMTESFLFISVFWKLGDHPKSY